jgi:hypothetical protein
MRVLLFLVAMATIVSICQGGNGPCTASVSKVCAYCQDVNTRCAVCKPGYQCKGSKASNCYCSANSAYACPAAATSVGCLSCSPFCPGFGTSYLSSGTTPQCMNKWNPQYGCSMCAQGYKIQQTLTPIAAGVAKLPSSCGYVNVTTCVAKS